MKKHIQMHFYKERDFGKITPCFQTKEPKSEPFTVVALDRTSNPKPKEKLAQELFKTFKKNFQS